ncbi:MAG: SAM-dependent chlorinase/fluorinase [Anaerolineales bacterium]|nr:SAM-dependent chlorinase/fluorinase [Anaerolineales bacterium]
MSIITITTDFGIKDGNVGAMKGVIWNIAPQAQIADLSHLISPQNIQEAALIVARAAPYFPDGAIHVVVVDPGVGTERRPIAGRLGSQFVVGPDNGVFTLLLQYFEQNNQLVQWVHLDQPHYWLKKISHVFHGRDIFAPVAAHLASGVALEELGSPINDPLRLNVKQPQRTVYGWRGDIIHIDHFGNIHTSIRAEHLGDASVATIRLCGVNIHGLVQTFGERSSGELVALFGSNGNLIVSVVNGNAVRRLNARLEDSVEVFLEE